MIANSVPSASDHWASVWPLNCRMSIGLRKMIDGQHHHVSPQHLHAYASHAAWTEDHRREDNGKLCHRALRLAMAHPVSREWKGYWQRSQRSAAV